MKDILSNQENSTSRIVLENRPIPDLDTVSQPGGGGVSETFAKIPHWLLWRTDLSASAKLVYAAIADRVGGNGSAWPGVRRLASDCGLGVTTVCEAVTALKSAGLLMVETGSERRTNNYKLTKRTESGRTDSGRTESERSARIPVRSRTDSEAQPDPLNQTHEPDLLFRGDTTKQPNPARKQKASESDAARIYAAYPRKVARADAVKEIQKALEVVGKRDGMMQPAEWLLGRVTEYAAARVGQEEKFTPHPATWFRKGRYDDDPATWKQSNRPTYAGNGRMNRNTNGHYRTSERTPERILNA